MTDTQPGTVEVRTATLPDVDGLAALAALTFPLACPPGTDPAAIARHVAQELSPTRFAAWVDDPETVLLAASRAPSPDVLGYALLCRGVATDVAALVGHGTTVELSKIYVHPDEQGSGLAHDLMRAALAQARSHLGTREVWLGTNGLNLRAQSFYRRHGFVVAGPRVYVVGGQAHDDVVMTSQLD